MRSYSDKLNGFLQAGLTYRGIVWPPADTSFDLICNLARVGLSWEYRLARALRSFGAAR